jgi:hypothetical protein
MAAAQMGGLCGTYDTSRDQTGPVHGKVRAPC